MRTGEIIFESGKPILLIDNRQRAFIPLEFGFTIEEHEGLFIDEFEIDWDLRLRSDVVVWMEVEGERHEARSGQRSSPETDDETSAPDPNRKPARAPYNFIPLNDKIVSAQTLPHHDRYYEEDGKLDTQEKKRYTGQIGLTITNKTPFYIRGRKPKNGDWIESDDFFSWDGKKPVIPGSSLRGLIRSLVEVVSWSEMRFVDVGDEGKKKLKYLFHRGMTDQAKSLENEYKKERPTITSADKVNEKVGLLRYIDGKFKIQPTSVLSTFNRGGGKYKITYDSSNLSWMVYPGPPVSRTSEGWEISTSGNGKPIPVSRKLCDIIKDDENRGEEVANVVECAMSFKVFNKYIKGTRPSNAVLKKGVPVFYQLDNHGEVSSFGHTRNYRIPYEKPIAGSIDQKWLNPENQLDFAHAIFGEITEKKNPDAHSTRVFFEDGLMEGEPEFCETEVHKVLSTPKPTTFQHYLEQPDSWKTPQNKVKHWGSSQSKIRGFKHYWHRNTDNAEKENWRWEEAKVSSSVFNEFLKRTGYSNGVQSYVDQHPTDFRIEDNNVFLMKSFKAYSSEMQKVLRKLFLPEDERTKQAQTSIIRPVKKATFQQRIRFENLSRQELGCLLFVLDLPEGCYHKLGLGKPLGLGSIEIKVDEPHISDRPGRYSKLFGDNGWHTPNDNTTSVDLNDYKNAFAAYMNGKAGITCTDWKSLWENMRLSELKHMLIFDHSYENPPYPDYWLDITRYQEIELQRIDPAGNRRMKPNGRPDDLNEYKDRRVLPSPSDVIDLYFKKTYKDLSKE